MTYVSQVLPKSKTVFYTEHNRFPAVSLVFIQVGWRAGYADVLAVLCNNLLQLIKNKVGIGCWRQACRQSLKLWIMLNNTGNIHCLRKFLTNCRLWKIGSHDNSVLPSVRHLVQIIQYSRVALVETNALWEKHRSITMGIKRQNAVVKVLGFLKTGRLIDKPCKQF